MAASTEMSSRQLAKGTDVSYLFLSQVKKVNRPMPDNLKVKLEYLNDCDSINCRYENGDSICFTSTRPGVRIPSPSTIFVSLEHHFFFLIQLCLGEFIIGQFTHR